MWTTVSACTTPGIPKHMHPVVALLTAGVEMDVLGLAYEEYSDAEREAVVKAFPRTPHFKEDIIQAFYEGIKHKPGNDVPATSRPTSLAVQGPAFRPREFLSSWFADRAGPADRRLPRKACAAAAQQLTRIDAASGLTLA